MGEGCRGAVGVFYSPSRLNNREGVVPLCRVAVIVFYSSSRLNNLNYHPDRGNLLLIEVKNKTLPLLLQVRNLFVAEPIFVTASHQTGLDTRSMTQRSIKVGIRGGGGRARAEARALLDYDAARFSRDKKKLVSARRMTDSEHRETKEIERQPLCPSAHKLLLCMRDSFSVSPLRVSPSSLLRRVPSRVSESVLIYIKYYILKIISYVIKVTRNCSITNISWF